MFGFRVTNETGGLQVFSESLNMSLRSKGTVYTPGGLDPNWEVRINMGQGIPNEAVLFVRPRISGRSVYSAMRKLQNGDTVAAFASEYATTTDWYVFAPPRKEDTTWFGEYGLRVYGEDGALSYATGARLLKIAGMLKISNGVDPYGYLSQHTLNLPTGRAYAGCVTYSRDYIDSQGDGGPYSQFHYDGVAVGDGYVRSSDCTVGMIEGDDYTKIFMAYGGLLIAADVTGY